jgi:hypothetical protein
MEPSAGASVFGRLQNAEITSARTPPGNVCKTVDGFAAVAHAASFAKSKDGVLQSLAYRAAMSEMAIQPAADERIRAIAVWQKRVILTILVSIGSIATPFVVDLPFPQAAWLAWMIAVILVRAYACVRLASCLQNGKGWWGALAVLPNLIGVIALLWVNSKATKELREAGWKVGLFGADVPAL